jgi:hypothetical protein
VKPSSVIAPVDVDEPTDRWDDGAGSDLEVDAPRRAVGQD